MKLYITLLFILSTAGSFGQRIVFDTAAIDPAVKNFDYYSKTNFSVVDTLSLWNYSLVIPYHGKEADGLIKPKGEITFWRTQSIDDKISNSVYSKRWRPQITFYIFDIKAKSYCYKKSTVTRLLSSCVPPEVGGDIIIMGSFVFLNSSVCLGCQRFDTKVDYCRPVINYIFSCVDTNKVTTIQNLVQQFPIKVGKLPSERR